MFNGSNPFTTFFLHNKGNCSILLYENTTGSLFNSKTNQVVFIRLYDMKYIDEKLITIYTEFDLN